MKNYFKKRNEFICPKCEHPIKIYSFWKWLFMPHLFDTWRYVKCPVCCERSWMKSIETYLGLKGSMKERISNDR